MAHKAHYWLHGIHSCHFVEDFVQSVYKPVRIVFVEHQGRLQFQDVVVGPVRLLKTKCRIKGTGSEQVYIIGQWTDL